MYAIIQVGGKQYKVRPGDVLQVEKLDYGLGAEVDLTDILMVGGRPFPPNIGPSQLNGAKVTVIVTKQAKDRKVIVFKKRRRQGYRRFKTHRQPFTEFFVKSISVDGSVEQTEETPIIVDVAQMRQDRINEKMELKKQRASSQTSIDEEPPIESVDDSAGSTGEGSVATKKKKRSAANAQRSLARGKTRKKAGTASKKSHKKKKSASPKKTKKAVAKSSAQKKATKKTAGSSKN